MVVWLSGYSVRLGILLQAILSHTEADKTFGIISDWIYYGVADVHRVCVCEWIDRGGRQERSRGCASFAAGKYLAMRNSGIGEGYVFCVICLIW